MKNKRGKVVSKKASARGKRIYAKQLKGWNTAFMQARKNLKIKGFVACKKGSKLYKEAMRLYKASKPEIIKGLDSKGLVFLYAVPWPAQGLYSKKQIKKSR